MWLRRYDPDACRADCTAPRCGDGVIDTGEDCDDGEGGCTAECGDRECGMDPVCGTTSCGECGGVGACLPDGVCSAGPTGIAPGDVVVVSGLSSPFSDLHRSSAGTLFVTTTGAPAVGNVQVARSADGGGSWAVTALGNAGQPTYLGRVFAINDALIGISSEQGSWFPYDGHLRVSDDDGVSYNDSWINFSLSAELRGERNGVVIETPGGRYLAVFPHAGFYWRVSDSLSDWSGTVRHTLISGETEDGRASLAVSGTSIFLAAPRAGGGFDLYVSGDDGETFDLLSHTDTEVRLSSTEIYLDATGAMSLCGVYYDLAATDDRVYTYTSDDGGATWGGESMYLGRLQRAVGSQVACHIDESGVYVGHQDLATNEVRIVLPGNPIECGNGIKEPGEACDGDDLYDTDCVGRGFGGGELRCDETCRFTTAACSAPTHPMSCDAVDSDVDGRYIIDPDGDGPNPPFEVHCHGMDTDDPQEYLPLVVTGGGSNTSHYQYIRPDSAVDCEFEMVRIADLSTMLIDGRDKQFAVCRGNMSSCTACQWGEAAACSGAGPVGWMSIDLTGTPFVVSDEVVWQTVGHVPSGGITRNDGPGRVVEATGDGFCGGTTWRTPPGLVLDFAE